MEKVLMGKFHSLISVEKKQEDASFLFFLPMKNIHSMVECLNHVQKYLA